MHKINKRKENAAAEDRRRFNSRAVVAQKQPFAQYFCPSHSCTFCPPIWLML